MVLMLSISLSVYQPLEDPLLKILCLDWFPVFNNYLLLFLISRPLSSLYILDINPLWNVELAKIISLSVVDTLPNWWCPVPYRTSVS